MDSILTSIKKLIGITGDYTHFDQDLIIHINSALAVLVQLGVGPEKGFSIQNELTTWTDFIGNDSRLELIKSYVYLKVKLLFDPPSSSAVAESIKRMIDELEWRITNIADSG